MPASLYNPDGLVLSLQQQINSILALMPTPSSAAPAGVADSAAVGTDATKFSIEGHVHPSKARKQVATVTTSSYTWTYPTAFASGVVPICNGIAQCTAGTTDLVNVQLDGPPTNTQCVFKITRYSQGVIGVVSGVLSLNATPLSIKLHMSALEP